MRNEIEMEREKIRRDEAKVGLGHREVVNKPDYECARAWLQ